MTTPLESSQISDTNILFFVGCFHKDR